MPHTPGPWLVSRSTVYALTEDALGRTVNRFTAIVQSAHQPHEAATGELEANARLMAAAPELLESLKALADFVDAYHRSVDASGYLDEAFAAIAKAEGEPGGSTYDRAMAVGRAGAVYYHRALAALAKGEPGDSDDEP